MDLVLWRHAEAVDAAPGQPDLLRRLTPKGERQASRVGAWLDRQLPDGAKIWVSPAKRTDQTAKALGRKYSTTDLLQPQCNMEQLLELVQWPGGKRCVVVVGHQPVLGQTLSHLLGFSEKECAIKKGGLWWLRCREHPLGNKTAVVTVQAPEFL
ncbi:MAG: histidine phosphatase family protein [Rhodoferax sp.]|nr:histidine phosphatase family protein [Rhodoferax sp.]MCF8208609.1 histidine phosphatase family protein [Rhodoferax sp.]